MRAGYWMAFRADIRTPPGVTDIQAHLYSALQVVRAHREIGGATYWYDPENWSVTFVLQLRHPIAPHVDALTAHTALIDSLERAGIGIQRLLTYSPAPVRLRVDRWPSFLR